MRTLSSRLERLSRETAARHPVKWPPVEVVFLAGAEPDAEEQARIDAAQAQRCGPLPRGCPVVLIIGNVPSAGEPGTAGAPASVLKVATA